MAIGTGKTRGFPGKDHVLSWYSIDNALYLRGFRPIWVIVFEPAANLYEFASYDPISAELFCRLQIDDVIILLGIDSRPQGTRGGVKHGGRDEVDIKRRPLRLQTSVEAQDLRHNNNLYSPQTPCADRPGSAHSHCRVYCWDVEQMVHPC